MLPRRFFLDAVADALQVLVARVAGTSFTPPCASVTLRRSSGGGVAVAGARPSSADGEFRSAEQRQRRAGADLRAWQ